VAFKAPKLPKAPKAPKAPKLGGLLDFFKERKWIIPLLGLISLLLIVWVAGPYLGWGSFKPLRPRAARLVALLVVALVWVAVAWWRQARAARANAEMVEGLAQASQDASQVDEQSREDVAALRERFQEAIGVFRKTRLKGRGGRQFLYELPWYLIIGPPGVGKTTALINSGLEFPLEARLGREPLGGVGGTRHCDFWFTNDAVLVDTAGRYTTQDSQQAVDSAGWTAFLQLLRKFRPRCPVNGVIVAVSLADIMLGSDKERESHAEAIRQRVQEVARQLGVNPPVYVVLTKADLIAGFQETYDDLGQDQRGQVWGITFPLEAPGAALDRFAPGFDGLLARVGERAMWRVGQERDLSRRALIAAFPNQVAGLKAAVDDFLQKTFKPSRYEIPPLVRGVYLSSGTQEGTPIDRVMGSLAETFGLDRQALAARHGTGRSYFITRLFKDVIFPESPLAGVNVGFERRTVWLRRAAYAGIAAAVVLVVFAWSTSFTRNQLYIGRVESRLDQFDRSASMAGQRPGLLEALPVLRDARSVSTVYGEGPTSWSLGLGLYQGHKLGTAAQDAYRRTARSLLFPQLKRRLELQLQSRMAGDPEELQKTLGLYLMLAEPETLQPDLLREWADTDWRTGLNLDPATSKELATHLEAALGGGLAPQPVDRTLVARATQVVCRIPLERLVYSRLEQVAAASGLPGFSAANVGGRAGALFTTARPDGPQMVPALYTREGYRQLVEGRGTEITKATIDENRKICENAQAFAGADPAEALRKVRERYFGQYTDQWSAYLGNLDLVPLSDLDQAAKAIGALAAGDSPLTDLVRAVATETAPTAGPVSDAAGAAPSDPVSRAFAPLRATLQAQGDVPAPMDAVLADLKELQGTLADLGGALELKRAAFEAAKARMGLDNRDAITRLRRTAGRMPAPLSQLVDSAATQSWGVMLALARQHVNEVWQATVVSEFRRTLENRYPLYSGSAQEATLSDFGHFFGNGGTLQTFFDGYLAPFVDTNRWQMRVVDNRSLGLSDASMRQLKHGTDMRAMIFQDGGQQPAVRFDLKPISLDADANSFLLELGGQSLTYRHGPARSTRVAWPGPQEQGSARMVFERSNGGRVSVTKDGPWAWFRLLDQSEVRGTSSPETMRVTFQTGGLTSVYELRATSAVHPMRSKELTRFRCPERL
jgi:type VI secretion system protein ImpL